MGNALRPFCVDRQEKTLCLEFVPIKKQGQGFKALPLFVLYKTLYGCSSVAADAEVAEVTVEAAGGVTKFSSSSTSL